MRAGVANSVYSKDNGLDVGEILFRLPATKKRFFSAHGCEAHWMSAVFIRVKAAGTYSTSSAEVENELCVRSLICLHGKL